mgnify:CR=1 FL=1
MSHEGHLMDRRTFITSSLIAGAGFALAASTGKITCAGMPSGQDLADLPLMELSGLIRRGDLSSQGLLEAYFKRIDRYGGKEGINAYITLAKESAMAQASELDRMAKEKRFRGPLHGLPIAVKDNLDTKNIRTTGGSAILAEWRPMRDANVIRKLREAGAIIVGKTNMHEFAFGITTNNTHYGPTRNPYDTSRIPGGSSGGSAAATAAALCAGAIGTDTGGSVRIPAALCGVVGLKPTLGRVGRSGLMYLSFTRDVIGPITRTVGDSALMLGAISGPDPGDPEGSATDADDYMKYIGKGIKGRIFGIPNKLFLENIHPDTEKVMNESIRAVKDLGGIVKDVEVKHMDIATPTGFNIVLAECIYLIEDYLKGFDSEASIEKYAEKFGADVRPPIVGSKEKPVPGYVYARSVRRDRNLMIHGFEQAMSGVDALLMPTTPLPAAKIGEDLKTELLGKEVDTFLTFIRNCDPVSVVGYPAISVPAGYSNNGLPIGLQIVGRPWEEAKIIGMAHAFEQATKQRKAPKLD